MDTYTRTMAHRAVRTPRSGASTPPAFPPHPPLQSGGWYRGSVTELPGPGRPPVVTDTKPPVRSAVVVVTLFCLLALLLLIV